MAHLYDVGYFRKKKHRKGTRGTRDLQYIDQHTLKEENKAEKCSEGIN